MRLGACHKVSKMHRQLANVPMNNCWKAQSSAKKIVGQKSNRPLAQNETAPQISEERIGQCFT